MNRNKIVKFTSGRHRATPTSKFVIEQLAPASPSSPRYSFKDSRNEEAKRGPPTNNKSPYERPSNIQ